MAVSNCFVRMPNSRPPTMTAKILCTYFGELFTSGDNCSRSWGSGAWGGAPVTADAGDVRVIAARSSAIPGGRCIAAPEVALARNFGLLCVIRARYGVR